MLSPTNADSRRRRGPRPLQVEGLEGRVCLASFVGLLDDGTLLLSGDNGADNFVIVDDGQGTIGVIGDFDDFGDDAIADDSGNYDAIFEGVSRIVVQTFGGNDTVNYQLSDALITPREVTMDLGAGNDRAAVSLGTVEGVDLAFDVNLGRGNDRLDASFLNDLIDASVRFDVDGAAGRDVIDVVSDDLFVNDLSVLDMVLAGGDGNDVVSADLELEPSSSGVLAVSVLGGRGNDFVELYVYGVDNVGDGSTAILDGGQGRDRFAATQEVDVFNVEKASRGR